MLSHYLKVAVRNLLRNKFFSTLNLLGFAVGLASCMAIMMFVRLVVSCDDLRPWVKRADHFAVLRGQRFIPLPPGVAAAEADDVLLDLLGRSIF